MKNRKKVFILTEVILAVLVVLVAFLMIQVKTGKAADKISIIVQNADDGQWAAFKYGVKMAAMDQNVETFVVSTGAVLTEEEQQKLIKQEISKVQGSRDSCGIRCVVNGQVVRCGAGSLCYGEGSGRRIVKGLQWKCGRKNAGDCLGDG